MSEVVMQNRDLMYHTQYQNAPRVLDRVPGSKLSGMVALINLNAELLQGLHVGLCLAVACEGLVAAPFGRLQGHRQLEAAEVDIVLRAPVSAPPAQS